MSKNFILIILILSMAITGCSTEKDSNPINNEEMNQENIEIQTEPREGSLNVELPNQNQEETESDLDEKILKIMAKYADKEPLFFGENILGVYTRIKTQEKILALTFDACGGKHGSEVDEELIAYLIQEEIPATLFINARWMKANEEFFLELSKISFLNLQNHGMEHKPLSTTGESVYGISGTLNLEEVLHEVLGQQKEMESLIYKSPKLFRSGTAYYDDIAIEVLDDLGVKAVNFSILGDAGATYSVQEMLSSAQRAKPGDILLYHMNQPEKQVAAGIKEVIPMLREKGFKFIKLIDYEDQLD